MNRQLPATPVGAFLILLLCACTSADRNITLAVSTEEPAPTLADTVRPMLEARGFSVAIETVTDPLEALASIRDHRLDLAIVEEPDRPQPGLITLAPLYPSVLHVLHNRAPPHDNFAELIRGASVYAGPSGGAAYRLLMRLAVDFDIDPKDFQLLDNPWTVNPDVYFIFGGLLSTESLARLDGYRLFSFREDDDIEGGTVADGIALRHQHLRPFLLPKGVYHGLSSDAVLTLSIRTVLAAHEDFDAELAFDIASQLFRNAQEISLSYPLVTHELNEEFQATDLMLPLHSGARRYLDRDRPGFIERHVDLLALYLTIMLAALSGGIALYRYRSQVRKDRVDVYYSQLLDIRRDMSNAHTSDYAACKNKVLDVQREVLDLLIDEQIAADTSLVAFISLSNQMIDELSKLSTHD